MPTPRRKNKSVAVVDDHSLFRNAVSNIVNNIKGPNNENPFNVVFEAENGQDFKTKLLNLSQPLDIVVLDINMPVMDGFETLKWINTDYSEIKVLMLSMFNDMETISTFMKEGAAGYLTKSASKEEIENAMKSIVSKGFFYDDFITISLIKTLKKINYTRDEYQEKKAGATKTLTNREKEFLKLLASELTYKEIADNMQLSLRTVDGYREELFRKFQVKSRVGLIMTAINEGIINATTYGQ